MSADPNLARLGQLARERRAELDHLTVKEAALIADVSDTTWTSMEAGNPASAKTYKGMELALAWKPGSAEAVLAGGNPTADKFAESRVRSFHQPGRPRDQWSSQHDQLLDNFDAASSVGKHRIVRFAEEVVKAENKALSSLSADDVLLAAADSGDPAGVGDAEDRGIDAPLEQPPD